MASNYQLNVLNDDPLAYWKLEQDTSAPFVSVNLGSLGATFNMSFNNNAVYVGSIIDPTDTCAKLFNTTNVLFSRNLFSTTNGVTNTFTVEGWIYVDRVPGSKAGKKEVIWSKTPNTGTVDEMLLCLTDSHNLELIDTELSQSFLINTINIPSKTWTHIAVVVADTKRKVYVNGIQLLDVTTTGYSTTGTTGFILGGYAKQSTPLTIIENATYTCFQGLVDEFAIYNTELSFDTIQSRLSISGQYNIDSILVKEQTSLITRITRYDVNWGQPLQAYTFDRAIQSFNPSGYWILDDPSGGTIPNIGGRVGFFNGVVSGNPSYLDDELTCSKYLNFDGIDDLVNVGAIQPTMLTHDVSISAWVKPSANSRTEVLLAKSKSGSPNSLDYVVYLEPTSTGNRVRFDVRDGASIISTVSTDSIQNGSWSHVFVTVDGESHNVYINGKLSASTVSTAVINPRVDNLLCIGGANGGSIGGVGAVNRFTGGVRNVAVFFTSIPVTKVYELYKIGATSSFVSPSKIVDTAPIFSGVGEVIPYSTYTQSLNPARYYRLSKAFVSGDSVIEDFATSPINGVYSSPTVNNTLPSPIVVKPVEFARSFRTQTSGTSRVDFTNNLNLGTAGARIPLSISFWYRRRSRSQSRTALFGHRNATSNGGFTVYQREKSVGLILHLTSGNQILSNVVEVAGTETDSDWVHITFTVSPEGTCISYLNGNPVSTATVTGNLGMLAPLVANHFSIGRPLPSVNNTEAPPFGITQLSLFNRVLSSQEIATQARLGKFGVYYINEIFSPELVSIGNNTLPCNEYPVLTNKQDITHLVEKDWSVEDTLESLMGNATLLVRESYDTSTVLDLLKENTYVTIEVRVTAPDGQDSGWISMGHYLSDGAPLASVNAQGEKIYSVNLRTVTKLLTLDYHTQDLVPDVLEVDRAVLYLETTTNSYYEFRYQRPGFSTSPIDNFRFAYNWIPSPVPRLYASNFTNVDPADPLDVRVGEEIPIRPSNNSVQIVYGTGSVVIDRDFYEDKFKDGGLGFPDPNTGIRAVFKRQATHADIDPSAVVSSLSWDIEDNKWYINFTDASLLDFSNKTMFVKSGRAKGKIFKIFDQRPALVSLPRSFNTRSVSGTATGVGVENWNTTTAVSTWRGWYGTGVGVGTTRTSNILRFTQLVTADQLPADSEIVGLEFLITRQYTDIIRLPGTPSATGDSTIRDIEIYALKNSVYVGSNRTKNTHWNRVRISSANGAVPQDNKYFVTDVYGSPNDLWGTTWTPAEINSTGFGIGIRLDSFNNVTSGFSLDYYEDIQGIVRSADPNDFLRAYVQEVKVRVYFRKGGDSIYITDYHLRPVNPVAEGLAVGDIVQIGDAHKVEDVERKILAWNGFQENDPTKPFYFSLGRDFFNPIMPPIENLGLLTRARPIDLLQQVREFTSPSYMMYYTRDGKLSSKTFIVNDAVSANHVLTNFFDESPDVSDINIYTRTVAIGEAETAFNIGTHISAGGQTSVRAYKLDNFASGTAQGLTLSQAQANVQLSRTIDGSHKSLNLSFGGATLYGVLYQRFGNSVKTTDMAEIPIACYDLGLNNVGGLITEFEVEAFEFLWFNTYPSGNTISQAYRIYYMTEQDYLTEFNASPPSVPSQTRADLADTDTRQYMPPSTARSWKLLVDTYPLEEGINRIDVESFLTAAPTKMRFIKVECVQPSYRFNIIGGDTNRYSRIVIPEMRVMSSRRIVATAELGTTPPFDLGNFKAYQNRVRSRTFINEPSPALTTYDLAKQKALSDLIELSQDFRPITVSTFNPIIHIGDIVEYTPSYTGTGDTTSHKYLVVQKSYNNATRTTNLILVRYSLEDLDG